MSGVFANRFGRRYSRDSLVVSSVKYSTSSAFVFLHVKYEYDCVKPAFASQRISFGRVNASDRKITPGSRRLTSSIIHAQNPNDLVCGLSTRKIRTPRSTQNSVTSSSACHSRRQSSDSKSSG